MVHAAMLRFGDIRKKIVLKHQEKYFDYLPGSVQDFKHTLNSINFD